MDDERRDELAALAAQLDGLRSHPAWALLRVEIEKRMRRDMLRLTSPTAPDLREVDWKRGFWAGALYVLAIPDHAMGTFEEAVKRATMMEEGDLR